MHSQCYEAPAGRNAATALHPHVVALFYRLTLALMHGCLSVRWEVEVRERTGVSQSVMDMFPLWTPWSPLRPRLADPCRFMVEKMALM